MGNLTVIFLAVTLKLGLPTNLLSSLCYVESKHVATAVAYNDGKTHSYGICQIKLEVAKQMGFKGTAKDLMKPEVNILYAGKFLSYQLKRYNMNMARGITAYNKGHSSGDGNSIYYKKVKSIWNSIDIADNK